MPRPRRRRRIGFEPEVTYFKPRGVPMNTLEEQIITKEMLEALRLQYILDLGQEEAAVRMGISQPSFHRIMQEARKNVTIALVEGKALRIE